MRLYLFEDRGRAQFEPFALTRPVGELLFGCETLRSRMERMLGTTRVQYLLPEHLSGFSEPGTPDLLRIEHIEAPCRVVSSRFVVEGRMPAFEATPADETGRSAALVSPEGLLVGWQVEALEHLPDDWEILGNAYDGDLPCITLGGRLLSTIWQLMSENAAQIDSDLRAAESTLPESFSGATYGDAPLVIAPNVVIGPNVVLDSRRGPIHIDSDVVIEPMTVLSGPCYIGVGTMILGGAVRDSSIGPHCKIRGEVDTSIVLGFSNKAHDGYLGHAVVGRWVNLGAMTTNSDLKNNYSSVKVELGAGAIDTGERKVGVFLGDHVKTGIGTLLGTGTVVGAGSNVMAGPIPPRRIPPFSWGSGDHYEAYELERFVATTKVIMARRDQTLEAGMEGILRRAWQITHGGAT